MLPSPLARSDPFLRLFLPLAIARHEAALQESDVRVTGVTAASDTATLLAFEVQVRARARAGGGWEGGAGRAPPLQGLLPTGATEPVVWHHRTPRRSLSACQQTGWTP
jgi:hypothetical protein